MACVAYQYPPFNTPLWSSVVYFILTLFSQFISYRNGVPASTIDQVLSQCKLMIEVCINYQYTREGTKPSQYQHVLHIRSNVEPFYWSNQTSSEMSDILIGIRDFTEDIFWLNMPFLLSLWWISDTHNVPTNERNCDTAASNQVMLHLEIDFLQWKSLYFIQISL